MVDYSKAATSKAAKEAFDSTVDSLIRAIEEIRKTHDEEWGIEEEFRKGRASIIEGVIPILKANNIKLARPLSRCNHEELMDELRKAAELLPYEAREEVEVAMVRIDGRYTKIVEQAKKLEALSEELARFHLPEKDYAKEVLVSFEELKKARKDTFEQKNPEDKPSTREERTVNNNSELEEVVNVSKADPDLLDTFEELVKTEKEAVQEKGDQTVPMIIEESDILAIESGEGEEEFSFEEAFDSLFDEGKEPDDVSLMEEFLDKKEDIIPEEADYQTYELKGDQTLSQIVDYVYEGKLSWYDIYRYGNNQGMIDRKCAESNIDPEDAAYTEGVLTGIAIEYPKNFVTYESIKKDMETEEKGFAKAA